MKKWTQKQKEKIKELYLVKNLTRKEIADKLGVTYSAIDNIISKEGWASSKTKDVPITLKEQTKLKKEVEKKDQQVKELMKRGKIHIHNFSGKTFKFGVVSDTHFGSLNEKKPELNSAYQYFLNEGIDIVFHCGDLIEGEKMFKGQEYERYISGGDNLVKNVVDNYPKTSIKTYFITGSHDLSYQKLAGIDVGDRITEKRPDLVYLGPDEQDIQITPGFIIRLVHPGKGSAYAITYNVQKYIESISGGQKPTICLFGHYHKANFLPCYRNVFAIQAGCLQGQTQFMRRGGLAAHVGFWIVEAMINKKQLVSKVKTEFIAFYEEATIHKTK